jgi:hypothetical protein
MRGAIDGELTMNVINTEQQPGIPEETTITRPEERIPVRYDWEQSGFWIDYELSTPAEAHSAHTDSPLYYCYDGGQTRAIVEAAQQHSDVIEIRYGPDSELQEYNIQEGVPQRIRPPGKCREL